MIHGKATHFVSRGRISNYFMLTIIFVHGTVAKCITLFKVQLQTKILSNASKFPLEPHANLTPKKRDAIIITNMNIKLFSEQITQFD